MKEVIISTPQETITLSQVLKEQPHPIIGFQKDAQKITLIPEEFNSHYYVARCVHSWERGNGYCPGGMNAGTLEEWCNFLTKSHNAKIFVFDSPQELFKWLSE